MAIGTTRLRDLITDSGEELYLRDGYRASAIGNENSFSQDIFRFFSSTKIQNSKYDVWVPVAPKLNVSLAGLWVPRLKGKPCKWIATGRLEKEGN